MLEIIVLTIVIVLAFIAASWYTNQRSQQRAHEFERELEIEDTETDDSFQQRFDALFDQELHSHDDATSADERLTDTGPAEPDLFDEASESKETAAASQDEQAGQPQDWDMVIAFTIMAPESKAFTGKAVKAALEQHDLRFGDMQIYHRQTAGSQKQTLFSVANILDPGTLLPDKFVSMTTPGLLIFAKLPGPVNGMALFDDLLDTARGMNEELGGVLCDETREPVSDALLESMRARILEYQMAEQAESNQIPNDYFN